jgi:RNA polymerase sigma factor (sigma-70 family)
LTKLAQPPEVETRAADTPVATASTTSDAAAMLYSLHRQRIYAYCRGQLHDSQEADDAVQSTFLYALALLRRGETPRAELPWLYTIAHNVCRTRRRALKRRSKLESAVDLETLHDTFGRNDPPREELAGLHRSLAALPVTQRNALLLREWQGLTYAEIALQLGLTESAVEAVLFRARRNLAQTLYRAGNRAASITSIAMLVSRLRRLAPFTSTVKAAAATVAVGAAVATVVPLTASPSVDHKRAGPPATDTTDVQPRARRNSIPPHARLTAPTRVRTADGHEVTAAPTQVESATADSLGTAPAPSNASAVADEPSAHPAKPSSTSADTATPVVEPPTTTPDVQTIVADAGNALPLPPDTVDSITQAVQTAASTTTTPVEQVAQSVVSSPPVQAVVTTATSSPNQLVSPQKGTLLPGQP